MDYTLAYLYKEKREKRIDSNPVCRIAMIKRRGRIHRRHGWESGRRSADLNVFCSFWFFANLCSFCPPTRAAGDGGGEGGKRAWEQVGVLQLEARLGGGFASARVDVRIFNVLVLPFQLEYWSGGCS